MPQGDDDEKRTLKPGYDTFYIGTPKNHVKPNPERPTTSVKVGN